MGIEQITTAKVCCVSCEIIFWITQEHQNRLRENKGTFFCPSGHGMSYQGKSETQMRVEAEEQVRACKSTIENLTKEIDQLKEPKKKTKKPAKKCEGVK